MQRPKADRALFKALGLGQEGWSLCHTCKYASWWGGCDDSYSECGHPLFLNNDQQVENAQQGADCWGYRPEYDELTTVDVFGAMLILKPMKGEHKSFAICPDCASRVVS